MNTMKYSMSAKEKKNLIRIAVALLLFAAVFTADKITPLAEVFGGAAGWVFPFALYLTVYLIIGYDILWKAVRGIFYGQVLDENFLMCVASLGAFALAIYNGVSGNATEGFDEACAVLIFYQVGEFFQSYATGRSRKSITSLMDIRPDYANLLSDGQAKRVDPAEVKAGDVIVINPGEKVPLDGVVIKGASSLDTKALTGESAPRELKEGDEILSGTVNLSSQLQVRVTREFYDSTVSKILELVENASEQKSRAENFITRFARYYTPAVVGVAAALAVVPGLITGAWATWIYRALTFLVVSCPCALVISVPLSFFAGIGTAARHGILVKGSNYLEKFNKANVFVFDKTGTLTKGNFSVTGIFPQERAEEILRLAAVAEKDSAHPIARSIVAEYGGAAEGGYTLTSVAGEGIIAEKEGEKIYCGNEKLMEDAGIAFERRSEPGTVVYVAKNREFIGSLIVEDEVKPEAREVISELKGSGCKAVMLTGDNRDIAASVAEKTGVTAFSASLLPQDKVAEVERLIKEKSAKDVLCFVGDGINDAPVIMRSDIGIAMGGAGSDAAIEAADAVLMKDDLRGISVFKRIAAKTMRIVMENIVFSIGVKLLILLLSALGITGMWWAVFGDVGVAIIAILNALRVSGNYNKEKTKIPAAAAAE